MNNNLDIIKYKRNIENYDVYIYRKLNTYSEILEEIYDLINQEKITNENYISIYNISTQYKKKQKEYDELKKDYNYIIRSYIEPKYFNASCIVSDFNYKNNELEILFSKFGHNSSYESIVFSKENDDLYIKKSNSFYGDEVFYLLSDTLSDLYDSFLKYKDFSSRSYELNSLNSNFLVNIDKYGVNISSEIFKLSSYSFMDEYDCKCNSGNVLTTVKQTADELFKKIFVSINDCPEWCREDLVEIRKNELKQSKIKKYFKRKKD